MTNIHKFTFIFALCSLKMSAADPSAPDGLSEDPPKLSMLASKMTGVCSKPDLVEDYVTSCNQSSLRIISDTEAFPGTVSINAYLKVKRQNSMMLAELINRALYNNKVPVQQPQFAFELLSSVLGIYARLCPTVPASFLQTVYHLFSYLHSEVAHSRTEYLPKRQQKWIATRINKCTKSLDPPPLLTDMCKETVMTVNNCTTFVCTDPENEFRIMRTDPIADVVFKSMEIVQSVCFPYFTESYRMFHLFHLAIMDTFTDDIKTRWETQLEEMNYWKRLLGPSFEYHLINLERCNVGIINNAKFDFRISRSSLPARIRLAAAIRKL